MKRSSRRVITIPRALSVLVVGTAGLSACPMPSAPGDATTTDATDVGVGDGSRQDVQDIVAADTVADTMTATDVTDAMDVSAIDASIDATIDVAMDAPDCAYTCFTDYAVLPDGQFVPIVIFSDGALSYDASCDAPPLDPRCGV